MEERLIKLLDRPLTISQIAKRLKFNNKDILKKHLKNLIASDKVCVIDGYYLRVLEGKFMLSNPKYGFIELLDEPDSEDYYVSVDDFNNAKDGDIVLFFTYKYSPTKTRAVITKVVRHTKLEVVGYVKEIKKKTKSFYNLIDNDGNEYRLLDKDLNESIKNAILRCELVYHETFVDAKIIEVLGYKDDPGIEISTIAAIHGFSHKFPDEVMEEVRTSIPNEVSKNDLTKRKNFTDLPIITIDGDDSKDFDDAIYVKKNDDNTYTLGVYIADVSHYVRFKTPLDNEAYKRGTSVYLADRVIPMLPRELSNGICSLNEGVIRLVMAITMTISNDGRCLNSEINEGYIKSRHRMTYNKVNKILEGNQDLIDEYNDIYQMLKEANELHLIVRKKREKEGSLDFNIDEYSFILNEDGSPKDIIKRSRGEAEKLIEDFMILANEEIAKYITRLNLPFLYRVHDKPVDDKLYDFFRLINYQKSKKDKEIYPNEIQNILSDLYDREDGQILANLLLRSMAKAKYSNINVGHYGLALKNYCHFTSPIRRYPDLIVHRIIKELILHPEHFNKRFSYYSENLPEIGLRTSTSERQAIECEREVNDMLYAYYMENHINEYHTGIITSITNFGMFVTIDKGIEGLVHTKNMNGIYHYDEKNIKLIGYKRTYSLGDKVEIVVIDSNRLTKRIDFILKEDYEEGINYESNGD